MAIACHRLTPDWTAAVRGFNGRLRAHGAGSILFPEAPGDGRPGAPLEREVVIAAEDGEVRGGYVLSRREFRFHDGNRRTVGTFQLPLSEGIIDKKYALVGPHLLFDAIRRQPLLYTLGIGGLDEPFARMLASARWQLHSVPFYFRIVRSSRFLRNIAYLRTSPLKRVLFDSLATFRVASLPIRAIHVLRDRFRGQRFDHEIIDAFTDCDDRVWRQAADAFSLIAVRRSQTLNALYPPADRKFIRLRILRDRSVAGWAVMMNNRWTGHRHFGSMRLGSIVDVLAAPGSESAVVATATRHLERAGADLIVSNLNHLAWAQALRSCGYLQGPSNFIFAASGALAESLSPYAERSRLIHMTRGDGDGPIHL